MLQNHLRGDASTVDLKHVLFQNEMLSPKLFDVVLNCTSYRTKIIETCTSSIDFETLEINVSSFDEIFQMLFIFEKVLTYIIILLSCQLIPF